MNESIIAIRHMRVTDRTELTFNSKELVVGEPCLLQGCRCITELAGQNGPLTFSKDAVSISSDR